MSAKKKIKDFIFGKADPLPENPCAEMTPGDKHVPHLKDELTGIELYTPPLDIKWAPVDENTKIKFIMDDADWKKWYEESPPVKIDIPMPKDWQVVSQIDDSAEFEQVLGMIDAGIVTLEEAIAHYKAQINAVEIKQQLVEEKLKLSEMKKKQEDAEYAAFESWLTKHGIKGLSAHSKEKVFKQWQGVHHDGKKKFATGGLVDSKGVLYTGYGYKYGEVEASKREVVDMYRNVPALAAKVVCPEDYHLSTAQAVLYSNKACPQSLYDLIQHLNDHHKWSREKIADWIETLDLDIEFKTTGAENEQD